MVESQFKSLNSLRFSEEEILFFNRVVGVASVGFSSRETDVRYG